MLIRLLLIVMVVQTIVVSGDADPDKSFGDNGKVLTDTNNSVEWINDIAIQNNDKIVVAGAGSKANNIYDFLAVRYDSNGSIDHSFNQTGVFEIDIRGNDSDDRAKGIVIQNNGKVILAGYSQNGSSDYDFTVVRLDSNGSLDTTFNHTGISIIDIRDNGKDDVAFDVTIQHSGKIIVAGHSKNNEGYFDFAILRYDTNGSLDPAFGANKNGIVVTDVCRECNDLVYSIALLDDDRIIVAGTSEDSFVLLRYSANGIQDMTFRAETYLSVCAQLYGISIQSDGKMVAAGCGESFEFATVRYKSDGTMDPTFDTDGKIIEHIGAYEAHASAVVIQNNGKIIVTGQSLDSDHHAFFTTLRYNNGGKPDTSFNGTGKKFDKLGATDAYAHCVVIQKDGKIIVGGGVYRAGEYNLAMIRYEGTPNLVLAPIYYLLQ